MFAAGPSYNKLKTNLRLCINRLKLLEKKKTELALKSRKEIADYISSGKVERAKIRVEHIIREDYLVEAMEILEMYCDLLLARFGLIEQMKTLDEGLAEAISSIIWVTPRLLADVAELKIVSEQLSAKYGKPYGQACRENAVGTVSEKLMHKMSVQAPPKITVEKYMIEIAKYYNVEYEPDPQVLREDETYAADALIDLAPAPPLPDKNDLDGPGGPSVGGGASGGGGGGFQYPPQSQHQPPYYQPPQNMGHLMYPPQGGMAYPPPINASSMNGSLYPCEKSLLNFEDGPPPYFPPDVATTNPSAPKNEPKMNPIQAPQATLPIAPADNLDLPELPGVPLDTPVHDGKGSSDEEDNIDFDDLTRRFEALKKKK